MHGRSPRWAVWLLALWLSVATPLSALGCLQACERAFETLTCCAVETTLPCSDHPCECEPCPVCSAPAPQPPFIKAEYFTIKIDIVGVLTKLPELQIVGSLPTPPPEPPFTPPDYRAPCANALRAPPVLS
ncbi:MAG: hypothetical protein N2651_01165 [Fimbriimonadales bacterium]|nr:hypothetical protein [Fimbriimonadales bacterium]